MNCLNSEETAFNPDKNIWNLPQNVLPKFKYHIFDKCLKNYYSYASRGTKVVKCVAMDVNFPMVGLKMGISMVVLILIQFV